MAKKGKSTKNKKKETRAKLAPGVGREILAVILTALAVLLTVVFFGGGGSLTDAIFRGLRWLLGYAVYMVPLILLFLAWRTFRKSETHPITGVTHFGLIMAVLALTGLLHVMTEPDEALALAQAGDGGGHLGYAVSSASTALLNVSGSVIIFVTLIVVGLVLALNVKLSELWAFIADQFSSDSDGGDMASQLGMGKRNVNKSATAAVAPKMKINAKVPLASMKQTKTEKEEEKEPEVLTASADPDWTLPSLELLDNKQGQASAGNPEANADKIKTTLDSFGVEVEMEEVNIGPTVTQYTLKPASGVKLSKITELEHNLALNLAAHSLRVEAPIPGKAAVGIELPNQKAAVVRMRELMKDSSWTKANKPLTFILGRGVAGQPIVTDLAKMPHLLIAGATGAGKSVMINSFLLSLLYRNSPNDLKLILVDPKQVELSVYHDIPHLLAPIITDPHKTISALKWAVEEMERRYSVFADLGTRSIGEYNALKDEDNMPYIVIVIDEMADLMMIASQDVESLVVRLAQKARATGIHLVLATQRPSVNVITGLIKANVPARISFRTASQVDSRTILDLGGAEKLLGNGDMLYSAADFIKPLRVQGVFVDTPEINRVTNYLREAREPQYNDDVLKQSVQLGGSKGGGGAVGDLSDADDDLFDDAAQLVIESGKASASYIQRRLRVGYARAARLLDMLEDQGIVSPPDGSRPREVLVSSMSEVIDDDESVA